MAWTKMQQAAIDARDANILVSAAAGSGKTAVLTERVLQRLLGNEKEEPISIDRFLIVTFTSAAAQEMKERIMGKLSDYIEKISQEENLEDPKALEKISDLEAQMALVHRASISTIHSFCLKTIKAYFNRLNIDPNVRVGSEAELNLMKYELLEDLLEEQFEEGDEDFLKLAEVYGSVQGMAPLIELILEVYTFSQSTPFPKMWLRSQVRHLKASYASVEEMPWAEAIEGYLKAQLMDLKVIYKEAISLCELPNGPELYKPVLEADQSFIQALDENSSLKELIHAVKETQFAMLPRKKQECDPRLKETVKDYRDLAKEVIKNLQNDLAYAEDPKLIEQLPKAGKLMETLVRLIEVFEARYTEAKSDASLVDYNDLEHLCMNLLVEPEFNDADELVNLKYTEVAKELSHFYKEVYIDEYQDSNTVQETILKAVAEGDLENGPTRFMVGDMKQSIYRFRLANPLIFAEKYQTWAKHIEEPQNPAKNICIDLSQNFRSRENILEGVNDLFKQVMSEAVGELVYDEYAELKVGNGYTEGSPEQLPEGSLADQIELHLLETKESEEDTETGLEDLKKVECEALMVAGLIDKLLKGEGNPTHIFDKDLGAYRKVEAKDIVVLLRATKDKAGIFETALINKGIGAYADVSSNFFEALEVQTMISYLQLIDNPLQDIPLITVLRSPIAGLSLDELVYIRKSSEAGCFYEALQQYVMLETSEVSTQLKAFLTALETYREASSELTLEELLSKLYIETGYYRYVSVLPTGPKKKANLDLLKKYAQEYQNSNNGKLFGFLQYLNKLYETSENLPEAKLTGETENLVRIMSIHKSKGLEFSVVFLCDAGKKFNNNDLMKSVLMHHKLGLAPEFIDTENYVKYPTIPKMAIKNQIISENISEEMRVLYVALTRPKEKLYITGTISDMEKKAKEWALFGSRKEEAILPLGVRKGGSYLNWIGMSLFAHSQFEAIRNLTGMTPLHLFEGHSKWKLTVWNKQMLGALEENDQDERMAKQNVLKDWDTEQVYGNYKEAIKARLDYQYPHQKAAMLPTKLSVSEIKKRSQEFADEPIAVSTLFNETQSERQLPSFIKTEEAIAGANRGTLIHSVFEHVDYINIKTKEALLETVQSLVAEHILKPEVLEVLDFKKLESFAHSEMVQRMAAASLMCKEKEFIYLMQANKVDEDYPEDEQILIQGIIDCYFIEDGQIVIVDYKTDYVDLKNKAESLEKIQKRYQKQLDLYAEALEGITGLPVKECVIYAYSVNEWLNLSRNI